MVTDFLLRGLVIGVSIAAPVGPIGILCIRRTLNEGQLAGLVSGLGAATADAIYGAMAAFGLTVIASLLIHQQDWIRLAGGLFLFYLGIRTLLSEVAQQPAQASRGLLGGYLSTFVLTLTNPLTILSFAAVFAGLGVGSSDGNSTMAALATVLGVFLGSALWWLALSAGVSLLRTRFSLRGLRWVNRISGAVLIGFAVVALTSLAL